MRRRRAAAVVTAAPRVQVLGLCRFSVPSLGAFQVEHDSIEERRAMLYAPERLEHRFLWFSHVALPSIRAQTDPDFRLIVLLGEDFPEPWLSQMQALIADVPQVVLDFAPPGPHREVCADAMRRHVDPTADVLAQFRLDDDDGVAVDFVARIRADLAAVLPVYGRADLMALDYCRGVLLTETDGILVPTLRRASLWTPALVLLSRPMAARMILDYPHHLIWRHMPLISFQDEAMFLRGSHGGNDSAIGQERRPETLPLERWPGLMQRRYGIDLSGFAAALKAHWNI